MTTDKARKHYVKPQVSRTRLAITLSTLYATCWSTVGSGPDEFGGCKYAGSNCKEAGSPE